MPNYAWVSNYVPGDAAAATAANLQEPSISIIPAILEIAKISEEVN